MAQAGSRDYARENMMCPCGRIPYLIRKRHVGYETGTPRSLSQDLKMIVVCRWLRNVSREIDAGEQPSIEANAQTKAIQGVEILVLKGHA